jgi:hypothetical protein
MSLPLVVFEEKSRLTSLLERFSLIPDPHGPCGVAYPLCQALPLVACAKMVDSVEAATQSDQARARQPQAPQKNRGMA